MQSDNLIFQLILNIGLLVLVANLLSKLKIIQNIIQQEHRSFKSQALLALMFGGIIILSTYTSIDIGTYNLNTRVIGAMTSGILGGPIVGLYASLIGAVYVYFFPSPRCLPWHPLFPQYCSDCSEVDSTLISREENGNTGICSSSPALRNSVT